MLFGDEPSPLYFRFSGCLMTVYKAAWKQNAWCSAQHFWSAGWVFRLS